MYPIPFTKLSTPDCNRKLLDSSLLIEAAKLMASPLPSGQKISSILQLLSKWRKLHFGRISLPNYTTHELEVAFHYGLCDDKLKTGCYTVNFDQGLTGYVWRSGQVAVVTDVMSEPIFIHQIAEPIEGSKHHVGFISVPVIVDGNTIGVLSTQRRANPRQRYADDVDLLRIIASMMSPVLQSMQHRAQNISFKPNQLDHDSGRWLHLCEQHGIIGSSRALLSAVMQVAQVKDSNAPIMLLGESGTGKEMFARMAHKESPRKDHPFICINCASIPEALLESELFGHEKGSFTGAYRRQQGKIEQAHKGTLFLDEIGDMPMDLQAKLLRVMQDKNIQPIGSEQPRHVDFRLITATHVNLAEAVAEGRFRLDLFYRLNVIPISLPPLRARYEDIPRLAQSFLSYYNQLYDRNVQFTQGVHENLQTYAWPGNIRQLQNFVERAVLQADGQWITVSQTKKALASEAPLITDNLIPSETENKTDTETQQDREKFRPYAKVKQSDFNDIQDALKKLRAIRRKQHVYLAIPPGNYVTALKSCKTLITWMAKQP